MSAANLAFRYRFWFLALIYFLGFGAYTLDHRQTAAWLAGLHAGGIHGGPGYPAWRALLGLSALLALLAGALRTWASAYLNSEVVHDARIRSERLVAAGPYRFTRNPLYLGGLLLAAAYGLMVSRLGFVILVGGHLWFYSRLMIGEEAALAAEHGDRYRAFRAAVPRFWPRWRGAPPAAPVPPRWWQAFWGESFLWVFVAGPVAYAIEPRLQGLPWVFVVGVVLRYAFLRLSRPAKPEIGAKAGDHPV